MDNIKVDWESLLDDLARLYAQVDRRVGRLETLHAARLVCRKGCHDCCVEGLTVFEVEAENIRRHHAKLLSETDPYPEGACAFLDPSGACRIYEDRPYVCRTQGLPLRWVDQLPDGVLVEMRDICPLNGEGQPVEDLSAQACWMIGPFEDRLARLQIAAYGGELRRIALRAMFQQDGFEVFLA
jgi:hypothetical protein